MKAWKNKNTKKILNDIQTIPNPLPFGYDPNDWTLEDVTESELAILCNVAQYHHTKRGLQGLFEDISITNTLKLGELL